MANLNNKTSVAKLPTSDAAPPYDELHDASFHIHIKSNYILYIMITYNIKTSNNKRTVMLRDFLENYVLTSQSSV